MTFATTTNTTNTATPSGVDYLKYDNCYYDAPWPQTVEAYSARYHHMHGLMLTTPPTHYSHRRLVVTTAGTALCATP